MHRFPLLLISCLCLLASVASGAESVTVDSRTRDVLNSGVVSFASGQLQIDHQQVIVGAGGGGTLLSSLTLAVPSTLFASDVSFNISTSDVTGTLALANAPANSIFGNPTGSSTSPSYITDPTIIKGLTGLTNVENTRLSTWPGSTNITTVGSITTGSIPFSNVSGTASTAQIANSAVTYGKIQNVAGNRLLGNFTGTTGVVGEISLGAGLALQGGSLVNTVTGGTGTVTNFTSGALSPLFTTNVATSTVTPTLSFTISNAAANTIFGNASGSSGPPSFLSSSTTRGVLEPSQIGTDATNTWTSGVTNFIEGASLTANRTRTLPPTSGYTDGTLIKYFDALTTGVFGPLFLPSGTDTLKGLNAAAWTSAPYLPFTAAAYGGGSKSITFQKKGTDWEVYALGGENLGIKSIQNPANPAGIATFDSSLLTTARTIAMQDGPLALMSPTDPFLPGVVTDINSDGSASKNQLSPTNLRPNEDVIGQAGVSVTGSSHTVISNGTIDTVRIAGTLTGPYTINWPNANSYSSGEAVTLLDASGSVNISNPVTVTASNGTDTFNGLSSFVFDETNGRKVITSDGAGGWIVSLAKTSIQPFNVITPVGSTFTVRSDTSAVKHNAHLNLINGVNTLAVSNPYDGMSIELVLVQPASGAAATLNLPIGSRVGTNGVGLVSLSSANGAVDRLRGSYEGTLGSFLWDAPIVNHTSAALPSAPTSLSVTAFTSSSVTLGWTDNATNETGFDVQRSTSGGGFMSVGSPAANATTFVDSTVSPSTSYSYKVRAQNGGGYSAYSNTVSQTTASGAPVADLWEVHFNEGSLNSAGATVGPAATLSIANWTTSTQSGSGAAFAPVAGMATATGLTVTQQGTAGTTAYTYRVHAWKNGGTHNQAASQATTTGNAILTSANFNRISWSAVTGADYYEVYRIASSGTPSSIGRLTGTGSGFTALTFDDTGVATNGSAPGIGTTDANTATANSSVTYGSQVLSVSFWAKSSYTVGAGVNNIVNLGASTVISAINSNRLQISFPGATGTVTGTVSNSVTRNGSAVNSGTTWHHVVVELDNSSTTNTGNEIKVYYDGLATPETVTYTVTTRSGAATFATATPITGSNGFAGAIDDVRIYNHALTTTDISSLFTGNAQ